MHFFRANSGIVVENIARLFDPEKTGFIPFTELLLAFSMSMRGSGIVWDQIRKK
jgi:hypothetical protein